MSGKIGWVVFALVVLALLALAFAAPTLSPYLPDSWTTYPETVPYLP